MHLLPYPNSYTLSIATIHVSTHTTTSRSNRSRSLASSRGDEDDDSRCGGVGDDNDEFNDDDIDERADEIAEHVSTQVQWRRLLQYFVHVLAARLGLHSTKPPASSVLVDGAIGTSTVTNSHQDNKGKLGGSGLGQLDHIQSSSTDGTTETGPAPEVSKERKWPCLLPVPLARARLLESLGAVTMCCFIDDDIICDGYSVTEEIFLLKGEGGKDDLAGGRSDTRINNHRGLGKDSRGQKPSVATPSALLSSAAKSIVLDLHGNPDARGSRFENPLWWKFLASLKPIGLNAMLTFAPTEPTEFRPRPPPQPINTTPAVHQQTPTPPPASSHTTGSSAASVSNNNSSSSGNAAAAPTGPGAVITVDTTNVGGRLRAKSDAGFRVAAVPSSSSTGMTEGAGGDVQEGGDAGDMGGPTSLSPLPPDGMKRRASKSSTRSKSGKFTLPGDLAMQGALVAHVRKVLPLEALRELAEEIGFTESDISCFTRLLEMNVVAPRLGDSRLLEDTHAWGQEETRRRGTLACQVRGAVVKDSRSGGLQMMSHGDPALLLSYCKEHWDGTNISPLSPSDRKEIMSIYERWDLEDFDVVAFAYTPVHNNLTPVILQAYNESILAVSTNNLLSQPEPGLLQGQGLGQSQGGVGPHGGGGAADNASSFPSSSSSSSFSQPPQTLRSVFSERTLADRVAGHKSAAGELENRRASEPVRHLTNLLLPMHSISSLSKTQRRLQLYSQAQPNCLYFVDPCTSLQLTLESTRERSTDLHGNDLLPDNSTAAAAATLSTPRDKDVSHAAAEPSSTSAVFSPIRSVDLVKKGSAVLADLFASLSDRVTVLSGAAAGGGKRPGGGHLKGESSSYGLNAIPKAKSADDVSLTAPASTPTTTDAAAAANAGADTLDPYINSSPKSTTKTGMTRTTDSRSSPTHSPTHTSMVMIMSDSSGPDNNNISKSQESSLITTTATASITDNTKTVAGKELRRLPDDDGHGQASFDVSLVETTSITTTVPLAASLGDAAMRENSDDAEEKDMDNVPSRFDVNRTDTFSSSSRSSNNNDDDGDTFSPLLASSSHSNYNTTNTDTTSTPINTTDSSPNSRTFPWSPLAFGHSGAPLASSPLHSPTHRSTHRILPFISSHIYYHISYRVSSFIFSQSSHISTPTSLSCLLPPHFCP